MTRITFGFIPVDNWRSNETSLINRLLTPIIFLVGGFSAGLWFGYRIYVLLSGSGDNLVTVDKGSYYMLGVGIGMLDLAFVVIWEQWLVKPLNKKVTIIFSRAAITSVVLLLALPHAIHYVSDDHLKAKVTRSAKKRLTNGYLFEISFMLENQ